MQLVALLMQQGGTGVFFVDLDTTISECIQKQWQTNATRTPPTLLSSLFTHTSFSLRAPDRGAASLCKKKHE